MRSILALFCLCGVTYAQCQDGKCPLTPVRSTIQKVAEVQPVRYAVRGAVQSVAHSVRSVSATHAASAVQGTCPCGPGCQCDVGGTPCPCATVGSRDYDGALITSVGLSVSVNSISQSSRQAIVEAAQQAHDDCTIDSAQLALIKLATLSPRVLSKVEEAVAMQATMHGYAIPMSSDGVSTGFDWGSITDFLKKVDWAKVAELITTLVKIFG